MFDSKKNLVTAFSTSGKLTLAHYLFVIRPLLELKKTYKVQKRKINLFFSIADLHGITTSHLPRKLIKLRWETAIYLFACGLGSDEVFVQSSIQGHSELTFILGCHINIGKLSTMTQFKSKSIKHEASLALLNYPLLMTSDILLYDADVFVSNDQKQHIELSRDLAEKMNNKFNKNLFQLPSLINLNNFHFYPYRMRNLQKNDKKMSKSEDNEQGIIFLDDQPEVILKKIIASKTDSENKIIFDFDQKPGISNLILIYALIENIKIDEAVKVLQKECSDYFALKQRIANLIIKILKPIQSISSKFEKNPDLIRFYLEKGRQRAQKQVDSKLHHIKKHLGFIF